MAEINSIELHTIIRSYVRYVLLSAQPVVGYEDIICITILELETSTALIIATVSYYGRSIEIHACNQINKRNFSAINCTSLVYLILLVLHFERFM